MKIPTNLVVAGTVLAAMVLLMFGVVLLFGAPLGIDPEIRSTVKRWTLGGGAIVASVVIPAFVAWLRRALADRNGNGKPDGFESDPPPPSSGAGGSAAMLIAVALAAAASTLTSGCGAGTPYELRSGLEATTEAIDHVDIYGGQLAERRGEETRAELRARAAEGDPELATVDLWLAAFDRLMAPVTDLSAGIEIARRSALAVQGAFDAWDAGAGPSPVLGVGACLIANVSNVDAILVELGVDVPPALTSIVALITPFAAGACTVPNLQPPARTAQEVAP
ncbi:MAG: hypothetical protein AB7T06_39545 [Kofleriaceae bacterium]